MNRDAERTLAARAVALGRAADPAGLDELGRLLATPSFEVRRLAASAIGKLAGLADPSASLAALTPILHDPHPQVRQYAVKALMLLKKQMCQHAGKRLISVYPKDLPCLSDLLSAKLALLGRPNATTASGIDAAQRSPPSEAAT